MVQRSDVEGYTFYNHRYGLTILESRFKTAATELYEALEGFKIKKSQIVAAGGGLSGIKSDLRKIFRQKGWTEKKFKAERTLNGLTHKTEFTIEHFRGESGEAGGVMLDIEWNAKDTAFDRSLEYLRRYHALGAISLGILITRGESLQEVLYDKICECFEEDEDLLNRKRKQFKVEDVRSYENPIELTAKKYLASKYGSTTTHWLKLLDRIHAGAGDPCPMVLVGIGDDRIV